MKNGYMDKASTVVALVYREGPSALLMLNKIMMSKNQLAALGVSTGKLL